jgi:Na+-transporting NADH:ubiquinone oxidoreductase subunit C
MKIDTNGNLYTFLYAAAMVIIVAMGLTFVAMKLQPAQEKNVRTEKMQNILQTIMPDEKIQEGNIEELYGKYIVRQYAVDADGNILIEGKTEAEENEVFNVDLKTEIRKSGYDNRRLPVYKAELEDGSKKTILPLRGNGLWGPVWGYISLEEDYNTIYGAVFDHQGETPGLGAEINQPFFEEQFKGRKLFDGNRLVSITVYKGGKGAAAAAGDTKHGVDGISGGTITSNGIEAMFKTDWLYAYEEYLKQNRK